MRTYGIKIPEAWQNKDNVATLVRQHKHKKRLKDKTKQTKSPISDVH